MSRAVLIALLLLGAAHARAETSVDAGPVRVAIECELVGRTKACPAFLRGLVDEQKVLLGAPRAGAEVVIYATATTVGTIDRLHLRFVGQMTGAPAPVELDVNLDTRATDDEQRAALAPGFRKGIARFVEVRHPSAVDVVLSVPKTLAGATAAGSPWGVELGVSGEGNYTAQYQTVGAHVHLIARYVRRRFRAFALQMVEGGMNRQPPLELEDGTLVSLDSERWKYRFGAEAIYSWSESWSVGIGSYTFFEDPKAQYDFNSRNRVAVEWDMFPADDPRGNRLAVFYHVGWIVERYNLRNVLGEKFAQYPSHGINAVGSVRHDRISYGLNLTSDAQVNHPGRRLLLTASPFATIQIGNHVDLNLSLSITKRTFPSPDPAAIDPSDYEQLSRLAYAEPLSLAGSLGLTFHWDPTNGVRNNRIESI
ncbi:MAG: hypothetical protein H0T42_32415 [Deltaproteobacteria bacterium]|nr:hypothetical protein [Deltaproteobacteria bacterium]